MFRRGSSTWEKRKRRRKEEKREEEREETEREEAERVRALQQQRSKGDGERWLSGRSATLTAGAAAAAGGGTLP